MNKSVDTLLRFKRADRARLPMTALSVPGTEGGNHRISLLPAGLTVMHTAVDLSGKAKIWFLIGRGKIGKSTLARYIAEVMDEQGGSAIVASADPGGRSLKGYRDGVSEPGGIDPLETRDWLRELIAHCMTNKVSAIVDLGGGSTALSALLAEIPELVELLEGDGDVVPIALHMTGVDQDDLAPLAMTEAMGFQPSATAILLNEVHGRSEQFAPVIEHPAYGDLLKRGGVPLWMPRLSLAAAQLCDAHKFRYHDATAAKVGPINAFAILSWLRAMKRELAPIASWVP